MQADLLSWTPPINRDKAFSGTSYDARFDYSRLNAQLRRVYDAVKDGAWLTLAEIETITNDPQASISSRLRDLRKLEYGSHIVDRRRRGIEERGLFEYQVRGKS